MDNWDDLRVFLAVARSGGLSAAGKTLKMDAATVGRRVSRLEAARGTVLFQRSQQGYSLTTSGQSLVAHVEAAEANLKSGLGALTSAQDRLEGQVRIGAPDGCANYVLPKVCALIAQAHPDLDIQIVALPRVFNLSRREADMAIGVSAPTAGRLVVQRICDYHLHLAAVHGTGAKTLADLKALPVVGYIQDMIFDQELDYLGEIGLRRVQIASNSVAVQMNMLRAGAGVGVVHQFAMPFAPELSRILTEIEFKRSYYMIRAKEDQKDQRLSQIADVLRKAIRNEVQRLEALATEGRNV